MGGSPASSPMPSRRGADNHADIRPTDLLPTARDTNRSPSSTAPNTPDHNSPITTLYLTFATLLPPVNTTTHQPTTTSSSSPSNPSPPPPPPDLKPYTDPTTWSPSTKYTMLLLSCIATFLTAYTSGSYSPPQDLIRQDLSPQSSPSTSPLSVTSNISVLTGITAFCLGFGLAPMVLAPFSEMNGRYPVFVVSGVVYVVFQAVCGVVTNLAGMVVARALVGIGASVFSTMVGGVIADMWGKEGRNMPMALFSGSVVAGTGAGPLVGAVMAWRWDYSDGEGNEGNRGPGARWKWVFWHQVIMGAVCMVFLVVYFRESRGSVLLSRKARALNRWYEEREREGWYGVWVSDNGEGAGSGGGEEEENADSKMSERGSTDEEKGSVIMGRGDETTGQQTNNGDSDGQALKRIRWIVKEDEERSSLGKMIAISVTRPFGMLFTEPVVFFFSVYVAFAWGILYLTFGCIPIIFRSQYGWNLEQAGYIFTALIVGAILSTAISIWSERILYHPQWRAVVELDEESGVESQSASQSNMKTADNNCPKSNSSSNDIGYQQRPGNGNDNPTSFSDDEKTKRASSSSSSLSMSSLSSSPPSLSTTQSATSPSSPFWTFMRRRFPAEAPESRLYFTCLTSTLLPLGMFLFGFTARPQIHWLVPTAGITLAAMGILSVYLAVFNYLADTYHRYASSALAAQSLCRNVLGGVFPLVTAVMLRDLGQTRAIAMLGGIAAGLSAVPWVLVFCGERIRARSPFASQLNADN